MSDSKLVDGVKNKGVYFCEHVRDGIVIDSWNTSNIVVNEGLNYELGVSFTGLTPVASWFLGLFQGNYTPSAGDTAATFPSSATECIAYNESARQVCSFSTPVAQSIDNSAALASFTFNSTVSVYGSFLVSSSAKAGTTGYLASAARFPVVKAMTAGDVLRVSYALALTSA